MSIGELLDTAGTLVIEADEYAPSYECEIGETDLRCERCLNPCRQHFDGPSGAQVCLDCKRLCDRTEFLADSASEQLGDLERES